MFAKRTVLVSTIALLMLTAVGSGGSAFAAQGQSNLRGESRRAAPAAQTPGVKGPFVGPPIMPVSSRVDLKRLPRRAAPVQKRVIPRLLPKSAARAPALAGPLDPVRQTTVGTTRTMAPIISFEGLPDPNLNPPNEIWYPPSANGDVSAAYYVQVVNIQVGIYGKSGNLLASPKSFDDLFAGQNVPAGNPCGNRENFGDTIVVYDATVQRWFLGDAGHPVDSDDVDVPPYFECIAVSKTSDPTGPWWLYALPATDHGTDPNNLLNDFAKFGVWPDGIYMTANMFLNDSWVKPRVWALNRSDLINGQPVRHVYFDLPSNYSSFLPANMRGGSLFNAPAGGTPEIFVSMEEPNLLHLFTMHVDWTTLGNSYMTQLSDLTVADFAAPGPCYPPGVTTGCVPEAGGPTAQPLDPLGDRLMMHLQYANIGGQESLWVNHTVASNSDAGRTGIRWYEIRDPFGSPTIHQQSTFLPSDSLYRWMGSIAVDRFGDAALGYSVSSSSTYPGIRYTGRLVEDPANTLDASEANLFQGTGAQTYTFRWGDYTSMTVDPTDGCTFWYTNEYYVTTGSNSNWSTRIGSFKLRPQCDFTYFFPIILKDELP